MQNYRYEAIQKDGKKVTKVERGSSLLKVKENLRKRGYTVLTIKPIKRVLWQIDPVNQYLGGVSYLELIMFTKYMRICLSAGLLLNEAISITIQQLKRGKLKAILEQAIKKVNTGSTFYDAVGKYKKHFPPVYLNILKIGEESGSLEEHLEHLEGFIQYAIRMKKTIISAMMYPIIIFIGLIGLMILLIVFVLPNILPIFNTFSVELPASTKFLIKLAEVGEHHRTLMLIGPLIFIIIMVYLFSANFMKKYLHWLYLRMPIVRTPLKAIQLSIISKTIGVLLKSGIPILEVVKITAEGTSNYYYNQHLMGCLKAIRCGDLISDEFRKEPLLYPPLVYQMVSIGERTESLDKIFLTIGQFYEDEATNFLKNLGSILEPTILIVVGIIVAMVVISIITPIFSITQNLGAM